MRKSKNKRKTDTDKQIEFIQEQMDYCASINDKENYWKLFSIRLKLKEKKYKEEWL